MIVSIFSVFWTVVLVCMRIWLLKCFHITIVLFKSCINFTLNFQCHPPLDKNPTSYHQTNQQINQTSRNNHQLPIWKQWRISNFLTLRRLLIRIRIHHTTYFDLDRSGSLIDGEWFTVDEECGDFCYFLIDEQLALLLEIGICVDFWTWASEGLVILGEYLLWIYFSIHHNILWAHLAVLLSP